MWLSSCSSLLVEKCVVLRASPPGEAVFITVDFDDAIAAAGGYKDYNAAAAAAAAAAAGGGYYHYNSL